MTDFEEMLPPCCEECEDEGNNPECFKTCERYKKFIEESDAAENARCGDFFEGQFTYKEYTGGDD